MSQWIKLKEATNFLLLKGKGKQVYLARGQTSHIQVSTKGLRPKIYLENNLKQVKLTRVS